MRHFPPPPEAIRVADASDVAYVCELTGLDVADYMARCTTFLSANCVFFLEPLTASILEGHMVCKPEGRGREALAAARTALSYAFEFMDVLVIIGRVPVEDRAARIFTRLMGFKSDGIRPRAPGDAMVEWFEMRRPECR